MAATISTFAYAGAVFIGAIHLGSAGAVVGDLQTIRPALRWKVGGGQINGAGLARIQKVVAGLDPQLVAANTAGDGGGLHASVAAHGALRSLHPGAVDALDAEATLAVLAMSGGSAGLRVVPKGFAPQVTARKKATQVISAQIGAIFGSAADPMLVGINTNNVGSIEADINAVRIDPEQMAAASPGSERRAGSRAHRVVR
jgi:hypothetical protein